MGGEPGDHRKAEPVQVIGELVQIGAIDAGIDQDQPTLPAHRDGIDDAYRKSPVSLIEFPHPVALMRLADCVGFEGVEQVGYRDGVSAVGAGAAEADAGAGLVAVVAPLLAVVAGVAG